MDLQSVDLQSVATAALLVPAVIFGVVGWRARRRGWTSFGIGLRGGGLSELLRGMAFSVPFLGALLLVFGLTRTSTMSLAGWDAGAVIGIWVYFLVLFLLEEIVFRAVLMTGLGVAAGRAAALLITAVLVAAPYALTAHTGVLPLVGAVVTNVFHGWARWRSGRIWWGLGQRWVWNSAVVTVGFADSAFSLAHPVLSQHLRGPDWLTGGAFGIEGGVIGIAFLVVMTAAASRFATGSRGPWQIEKG